jgi:arabinogalactan endo-1,4-beta-galactosidase
MAEAFYAAMDEAGFRADQLGMSYYPTAIENGLDRLAAAQQTIQSLRAGLGRRIFVAEFGYPSSTMGPPFPWNATVAGYPESPQGQYSFLKNLVSWGRTTGNLSGIRPWAPDYLTSFWQPMSLYAAAGSQGVAQPGLDAIADGLDAAGEAGGLVDRVTYCGTGCAQGQPGDHRPCGNGLLRGPARGSGRSRPGA